jgi:hypothetical protein
MYDAGPVSNNLVIAGKESAEAWPDPFWQSSSEASGGRIANRLLALKPTAAAAHSDGSGAQTYGLVLGERRLNFLVRRRQGDRSYQEAPLVESI